MKPTFILTGLVCTTCNHTMTVRALQRVISCACGRLPVMVVEFNTREEAEPSHIEGELIMTPDITHPVLNSYGVFCPLCRFMLEPRILSSGNRIYMHNFISSYMIEEMPDFPICYNNQTMFLETVRGLIRMDPIL